MTRNLQLFLLVRIVLFVFQRTTCRARLSVFKFRIKCLGYVEFPLSRYHEILPRGINESQNLKIRPEHPATYTSLVVVYAPLPIKASGAVHLIGRRP